MPDLASENSRDYVAEQVEIIRAIPEGIHLAYYPTHDDSSACWCHPAPAWRIEGWYWIHKDLARGEFDA